VDARGVQGGGGGNPYRSPSLSAEGKKRFGELMERAIVEGTEESLAEELKPRSCGRSTSRRPWAASGVPSRRGRRWRWPAPSSTPGTTGDSAAN
jgi:hypothetical protein